MGPSLAFAIAALCAQRGLAAEPPQPRAVNPGLGMTKATAIEVCGPSGDRAYFDRLRCPDGSLIRYERMGSEGLRNEPKTDLERYDVKAQMLTSAPIPSGQRDFHRVDGYNVECAAGKSYMYVDRYHCPDPKDQGPPPGFSFRKAQSSGATQMEAKPTGYGLTRETAIEVCGPSGEREYVDRLRCPDGTAVRWQRSGGMGFRSDVYTTADRDALQEQLTNSGPIRTGQKDFHMLDGYDAECPTFKAYVFLDPYHCPDPKNQGPPAGFSLGEGAKGK